MSEEENDKETSPRKTTDYKSDEEQNQELDIIRAVKQAIRDFRLSENWSQEKMAKHLGVKQQELSQMEVKGNLSLVQLYKLRSLGIEVERFFDEDARSTHPVVRAYQIAQNLWDGGMVAVFPTRREGLRDLMRNVQRERVGIHIVGSSLKGVIMDRVFLDAMEDRVRSGVELKVLIGHPAFSVLRARVEGRETQAISMEIIETIKNYCKRFQELARDKEGKQVQIRVALHPPTIFSIFLMSQRRALINPYSFTIEAYNTPCLLIANTGKRDCMFQQYHQHHFENAWDCQRRLHREVSIDLDDPRMNEKQVNEAKDSFEQAYESVVRQAAHDGRA